MKKVLLCLLISIVFLVFGCSPGNLPVSPSQNGSQQGENQGANQTDKGSAVNNGGTGQDNTSNNSGQSTAVKQTATVKVFLVALEDNGKSGKKIASGDSLVAINRTITTPKTPLTAAMRELLSIKERTYGQSGLYDALYQSDLKLDSAKIVDGTAIINLSGKLALGGVMDTPRVKAQLFETALQFPTVKDVQVFINGKSIDDALSLK